MNRTSPPLRVVDAFGLTGEVTATPSRDVWGVGSVALKRVTHPRETAWVCELLAGRSAPADFRLPTPLRATDGQWVVDGWAAATWIPGSQDGSRWRDLLETATRFHNWLSDVPRPGWLDDIEDPWRAADRMAWGEQPISVLSEFVPLAEALTTLRRPLSATGTQLVHGDLTGNVLFALGLPPGIIDLTLYWRPPTYAAAIVAVDGFEWEGVGGEALDHVAALPDGHQMLVRAALFRIVRAGLEHWTNLEERLNTHRRTVSAVESRVR